jgi:ubiquinone/menaquinone biosynthesis C-methylase UbiE/GNAT superfamily N-acetyltransferase
MISNLFQTMVKLFSSSKAVGIGEVRLATLEDVQSVLEIEKRCYPITMRDTKEEIQNYIKAFPQGFMVYHCSGKVVAYLNSVRWKRNKLYDEWSGIAAHDKDGDLLLINSVLIDKRSRRCGVATKLMKAMIEYADEQNIHKVMIAVSPKRKDSIRFLESTGFSQAHFMEWYFDSETEKDEYTPAFIYEKCVTPRKEDAEALIKRYSGNLEDTYKTVKPDELLSNGWHGHYQEILADVQSGEKILEAAFGKGLFLMKAHDKGAKCIGIDISQHFVEAARIMLDNKGYTDIDVFHGDMTELQFSDHTFDRLVAVYVLCHYAKHQIPVILKSMIRVIKPHGKLDFEVMSSNSKHHDHAPDAQAYELTEGSNFSAEELISMMNELGVSSDNIRLSERLAPWSENEDQEYQQMSWLVQASF